MRYKGVHGRSPVFGCAARTRHHACTVHADSPTRLPASPGSVAWVETSWVGCGEPRWSEPPTPTHAPHIHTHARNETTTATQKRSLTSFSQEYCSTISQFTHGLSTPVKWGEGGVGGEGAVKVRVKFDWTHNHLDLPPEPAGRDTRRTVQETRRPQPHVPHPCWAVHSIWRNEPE